MARRPPAPKPKPPAGDELDNKEQVPAQSAEEAQASEQDYHSHPKFQKFKKPQGEN